MKQKVRPGSRTSRVRNWAAGMRRRTAALYLALKRKDTPLPAKLLAAVTVGYALSPIDLIPDFIPILGYLDDLFLLPLLAALTIRCIPGPLFAECERQAEGMWEDGKPKRWIYALPIIGIWLLLLAAAVMAFFF